MSTGLSTGTVPGQTVLPCSGLPHRGSRAYRPAPGQCLRRGAVSTGLSTGTVPGQTVLPCGAAQSGHAPQGQQGIQSGPGAVCCPAGAAASQKNFKKNFPKKILKNFSQKLFFKKKIFLNFPQKIKKKIFFKIFCPKKIFSKTIISKFFL